MKTWTVSDVMTGDVIAAHESTTYRELVEKLARHGISAVPVVNAAHEVVGIVSEADLLCKMEFAGEMHTRKMFEGKAQRVARAKSEADIALDLMTTPVVTIEVDASISLAAKRMSERRVKRLPVVDVDGKLIGIVSRSDLLRAYLRPDEDIRWEIAEDVLRRTLWIDPAVVTANVDDGTVTLRGRVDRRGTAALVAKLVAAVPGVVEVNSELTWDLDDLELDMAALYRSHPFNAEAR